MPTGASWRECSATSTSTPRRTWARRATATGVSRTCWRTSPKPALDLRPSRIEGDIIGECYIYLISRFASDAGKKAGEFYTPSAVSGLLASLAAPAEGDTICDPACGSGSLLIKAAQEVGSRNFALYGQEVNGATWALARMNLFLHGMDAARIDWCNTLTAPTLMEGDRLRTFDVVVANPPLLAQEVGRGGRGVGSARALLARGAATVQG